MMAMVSTPSEVLNRATILRNLWAGRNYNFGIWYNVLSMKDELRTRGRESVVANDPRTLYNLALHLLTPSNLPHRIPIMGLTPEAQAWASSLEQVITSTWGRLDRTYRRSGRKTWLEHTVGLMLATGWYAVQVMATSDGLIAEAWNPADVYPNYDPDLGLLELAHIYTVTADVANSKAENHGWSVRKFMPFEKVTITDYWHRYENEIHNMVLFGNQTAKPMTAEPFNEIPILVGPVAGLPDDGAISEQWANRTATGDGWRDNLGQSILATNSGIYRNYNRQLTFQQQILREVAQPKYWERSPDNRGIIKPEEMDKPGTIWRLGPSEEIGVVNMAPLPLELQTALSGYQNMIQRGGFPNQLFGNFDSAMPAVLLTQMASQAVTVLAAFHSAVSYLLSEIDNIWMRGILDGIYVPVGAIVPQGDPPMNLTFDMSFPIYVPGDLINRATVARMLAPDIRLSPDTVMDLFFPEIQDPKEERGRVAAIDAEKHPVFVQVQLYNAFRDQANLMRSLGQMEEADLFDNAAKAIVATLAQAAQGAAGSQGQENGQRQPIGNRSEAINPQMQEMLKQMGAQ